mmetsp:Transcript_835/g.764  ORF Transcript_835/g.764 Transcript_835/m.764 type:complete len:87 (+) Transcript_835:54-314(+)
MELSEGAKQQINALLEDPKLLEEVAADTFKQCDVDVNSFVDRQEMNRLFEGLAKDIGIPLPSEEKIDEFYKEMDHDKDGQINYTEF